MELRNYGEHVLEFVRDSPRELARAVACVYCDLSGARIVRDRLILCPATNLIS